MPEGRHESIALLALERAEGIGHGRLRSLLEFFGSARAALAAGDWTEAIGPGRVGLGGGAVGAARCGRGALSDIGCC